jgi:hypothetical protein
MVVGKAPWWMGQTERTSFLTQGAAWMLHSKILRAMSERDLLALILGSGVSGANVKQVAATLLRKCRSVEVILTGRASPGLPPALAHDFGRLRYVCHLYGTIRHLVTKAHLQAGLLVSNWGENVFGVAEGA